MEFAHLLPPFALTKIDVVQVSEEGIEYKFLWKENNSGKFFISSGINLIREEPSINQSSS
ncbi:hypothetical protein V2J09_021686 [Rumex salicifolius]